MRTEIALVSFGIVVLIVLALALAYIVLPVCGVRLGSFGTLQFCPLPASGDLSSVLAEEAERQAVLKERLRGLERRLAALPACPLPPPARAEPKTVQSEIAQPEPAPEGLDPERWRERDTALLKGCWSLDSDYTLRNITTGKRTRVTSWEMCFDAQGRGEQQFRLSDGRECEADVTAEFLDDGRLRINDEADVQCSGASSIFRRVTDCTLESNGQAACESRQPGRTGRSSVRISRRVSR